MNEYVNTNEHKFALLRGQKAPSAVFIGNQKCMDNGGFQEVSDWNYDSILQTVEQLRKNNIDAVPMFSELALDPSKTVVTAGGIQTPVLPASKLEKAAKQIFEALDGGKLREEYQGRYQGYSDRDFATCAPVEFCQMAPAAKISANIYGKRFESGLTHPDTDEFIKLREKYGFDLEYDLISGIKDKDLISVEQIKKDNESSLKSVYRGGCLGDTPYISFASRENKAFAYATPDIECAAMYSGINEYYGVQLQATSSNRKDTKNFGLIYEFEASPTTRLYSDWSIERGTQAYISASSANIKSTEWSGKQLETTVTQSQNKLKNIYVHIRKDGKNTLYPIPLEDKKWQAFLALHKSSDTCLRGYMIERRKKILDEKKVFSSLNNRKKFAIFKTKLKPINWELLNKEEAIKSANLTMEEKRALLKQDNAQTPDFQKSRDVVARIKELRCSKATTAYVATQGQQKTIPGLVMKYVSKNEKTGSCL